jgi:hypothetical protein
MSQKPHYCSWYEHTNVGDVGFLGGLSLRELRDVLDDRNVKLCELMPQFTFDELFGYQTCVEHVGDAVYVATKRLGGAVTVRAID